MFKVGDSVVGRLPDDGGAVRGTIFMMGSGRVSIEVTSGEIHTFRESQVSREGDTQEVF